MWTDTRLSTSFGRPVTKLWRKQRPISENIMVCYTSMNYSATVDALNNSMSRRVSLKTLGQNIRHHHAKWGGFTELLAIVWHQDREAPQILELMPDAYKPKPRTGIIGIGHDDVLKRVEAMIQRLHSRPRADSLDSRRP
jgi:hypothetical protein